jgi:hypothetical protein
MVSLQSYRNAPVFASRRRAKKPCVCPPQPNASKLCLSTSVRSPAVLPGDILLVESCNFLLPPAQRPARQGNAVSPPCPRLGLSLQELRRILAVVVLCHTNYDLPHTSIISKEKYGNRKVVLRVERVAIQFKTSRGGGCRSLPIRRRTSVNSLGVLRHALQRAGEQQYPLLYGVGRIGTQDLRQSNLRHLIDRAST